MRESSETELKYLLESDEALERFQSELPGFEGERQQENIYLDQAGLLRAKGCLFRIRIENGEGVVTLKMSGGLVSGVGRAVEFSENLDSDSLRFIHQGDFIQALSGHSCIEKAEAVCEVPLKSLSEWGRIQNQRRRYRLEGGWLIEVDRSRYPGGEIRREIELESEDPQAARQVIEPFFEKSAVEWRWAKESKSSQLFRILNSATE